MKTTVEYLDAVKEHLGLPSDYATAKALGVTRAAVSGYRNGRTVPDELVCARMASILDIEPIEIIAAAGYERSKDERARAVWESIWGKAAGVIAKASIVCVVGLSAAITPTSQARASGNTGNAGGGGHGATLYVMSSYRRSRQRQESYALKLAA